MATWINGAEESGGGSGDALTTNPLSQFAATTSAQLAGVISDETGSGALVFATSPTLVTPALGTPSSVNLANATGLPLAGMANLTGPTVIGKDTGTGVPIALTPAQAVAIIDAGRLVASDTPIAATTSMTATGTFAAGKVYEFVGAVKVVTGGTAFSFGINGDEVAANYRRGGTFSTSGLFDTTGAISGTADSAGDLTAFAGKIWQPIASNTVFWQVSFMGERASNRYIEGGGYHVSATSLASLHVWGGAADKIDIGSFIKAWEIKA